MAKEAPWEREELERWRTTAGISKVTEDTVPVDVDWADILSRYPRWQWAVIAIANVVAVMFYFEIVLFPYRLLHMGGFELILCVLFSDLIAETQRTKRNFPLTWWLVAFVFSVPTLVYQYFFPFEKDRSQKLQQKHDACFAVACLLYWGGLKLYGCLH